VLITNSISNELSTSSILSLRPVPDSFALISNAGDKVQPDSVYKNP
jgi:hypothetical protein